MIDFLPALFDCFNIALCKANACSLPYPIPPASQTSFGDQEKGGGMVLNGAELNLSLLKKSHRGWAWELSRAVLVPFIGSFVPRVEKVPKDQVL